MGTDAVAFVARSGSPRLFLRAAGFSYVVDEAGDTDNSDHCHASLTQARSFRVDVDFVGASSRASVHGVDPVEGYTNVYTAELSSGALHLRSYRKVVYENIYSSIDVVFYTTGSGVKYDFVVHAGGDPSNIRLRYRGATARRLSDARVEVATELGIITENLPVAYQGRHDPGRLDTAGRVQASFTLTDGTLGIAVGSYDATEDLVIDPEVLWSTFLGGSGEEYQWEGGGIHTDQHGNTFVIGRTSSGDFPTVPGMVYTHAGLFDAYVAKLTPGGAHAWTVLFGGSGVEFGHGVDVSAAGNVYFCGHTESSDLPMIAAQGNTTHDGSYNGGLDLFLVKANAQGAIQWSTYVGGSGDDDAYGFSLDRSGATESLVFSGFSSSQGLSTDATWLNGTYDTFIGRFSATGTRQWTTYYGGTDANAVPDAETDDVGFAVAVDGAGQVYVCGATVAADLPMTASPPVYQRQIGGSAPGCDAYVAKFTSGGALAWGTYLGSSSNDCTYDIACDGSYVWVCGVTQSSNFPNTTGLVSTRPGFRDGFVAKFKAAGGDIPGQGSDHLVWSTYVGGAADDVAYDLALTSTGSIAVAGWTLSDDLPEPTNSLAMPQSYRAGASDAFLIQLNSAGSAVEWGTYFGGCGDDVAKAVSVGPDGALTIHGNTASVGLPTTKNAHDRTLSGDVDAFVAKFGTRVPWTTYYGGDGLDNASAVTTDISGSVIVVGWTNSSLFPVGHSDPSMSPYQSTIYPNSTDAIIVKMNALGQRLWATYYGGSGSDWITDVAVDDLNHIVVCGNSTSHNPAEKIGPTADPNGYTFAHSALRDAFVSEFDANGLRTWSTFYGGSDEDNAEGVDVTGDGDVVVVGSTKSTDIPVVTGKGQNTSLLGATDIFVARFDRLSASRRHQLGWATYLGGGDDDDGYAVVFGGQEDVYITGSARATGFTPQQVTGQTGERDAYVVRLGGGDGLLAWDHVIGGVADDAFDDIAVGSSGVLALAGSTWGSDFPTVDPFQPSPNTANTSGIVATIDPQLGSIGWASYFGGVLDNTWFESIACDASGNLFAAGGTKDNGLVFPLNSPASSFAGESDGVMLRVSLGGTPNWGRYLGGVERDVIHGIAVDGAGDPLTTGSTEGGFPVTGGAFQTSYGGAQDAFISYLMIPYNTGTSTYLGGSDGWEAAEDVCFDGDDNMIIVGRSTSTDFPVLGPGSLFAGGTDAFVTKLDRNGGRRWSIYFGGTGYDIAKGVAVDEYGSIGVCGWTNSSADRFPLVNPWQPTYGGGPYDGFVTLLNKCGTILWSTYVGGSGDDRAYDVAFGLDATRQHRTDLVAVGVTGSTPPTATPFPLVGTPFQVTFNPNALGQPSGSGASDAFVVRFPGTGGMPRWSSLHGGSGDDEARGVAVGTHLTTGEYIAVTGLTRSNGDLPLSTPIPGLVAAPFQGVYVGNTDAFLMVVRRGTAPPTTATRLYSTYIGGHFEDVGEDVAIDINGWMTLTGYTLSFDFPVTNPAFFLNPWELPALQSNINLGLNTIKYDGFAMRFFGGPEPGSPALLGSRRWSTFLGGSDDDFGFGVALNGDMDASLVGITWSADLPLLNPFDANLDAWEPDAYVISLDAANALRWSTYLGGTMWDDATSTAVLSQDDVLIAGHTNSVDLPTRIGALQPESPGTGDAFLTRLTPDGNGLLKRTESGHMYDDCHSTIENSREMLPELAGDVYVLYNGSTAHVEIPMAECDGRLGISIYAADGRLVVTGPQLLVDTREHVATMQLPRLAPGWYVASVSCESAVSSRRFLILN